MSKADLLCIALPSWRGNYAKSTVQLMHGLSRYYRILYVDYAYTIKDVLLALLGKSNIPLSSIIISSRSLRKEVSREGEEIFILSLPPLLPVNWIRHKKLFWQLSRFNAWLARRRIRLAMRQMGMHNPLLVNAFQPFLGVHLYQSLGMHKTIYYCYDEMAEARWLGRHGSYMEAEMMRLADLVISSSEALEMRKKQYCRASTTVTNGVDFNSFYNARMNEPKRQQKATIGYTGSIDERFDTGLMAEVIAQLPGLEFRFVGRVSNEKARQRLKGFPNVTFLGAVAPDEVPQLMGQMDVGIIPYLENELTRYVYPLKINEFLAMGLPVVMTPFADLPEFRGLVYQAAAAEEFARCLLQALAEENTQLTERRFRHAASRSWEHQAEKFHAALSGLHVSKYQQEVV